MSLSFSSNHSLSLTPLQKYAGASQDELDSTVEKSSASLPTQIGHTHHDTSIKLPKYLYVIPVLFMEFLALALTRAVIPNLLLYTYGDNVYVVMGT